MLNFSNYKFIITGGAGFIGSTLADKLILNNCEVVIIDNLASGKKEYLNPKAKFYLADICNKNEMDKIFKQEVKENDKVCLFHLAAQINVRVSVENPKLDNEINVIGGLNILDCSQKYKIEKIIFSSTGGAIYGGAQIIPTPENYPTNPLSPYGIHKLTFEKYLNYYYKIFGQKYTTLRFSNVYGPRQYKGGECGVIAIFIENALNDKNIFINGDGLQTRDFVYVDDIVEAFLLAVKSDFVGEVNISTNTETNLLQVIQRIELILDKKINKKYLEKKLGEEYRSCLNNSLAQKILGWTPKTDLKEGIRQIIKMINN